MYLLLNAQKIYLTNLFCLLNQTLQLCYDKDKGGTWKTLDFLDRERETSKKDVIFSFFFVTASQGNFWLEDIFSNHQ